MDDISLIRSRFEDLAKRAGDRGICLPSCFLTLAEQSELKSMRLPVKYELFGGYEYAERKIAVFLGNANPPIDGKRSEYTRCIKISPKGRDFSEKFTHRDCLGSVMGLGIKRETVGDILLSETDAYLICLASVADFILESLTKIGGTAVLCEDIECLPDDASPKPESAEIIVSSERIDAVAAAAFNLSRGESQRLIESEKVFCDGAKVKSPSFCPKTGQRITLRGKGKFIYGGVLKTTKKGRLIAEIQKY